MMAKILSFVLSQDGNTKGHGLMNRNDISKPKSWQDIDDEYKAELLGNEQEDECFEPVLHIDDIVIFSATL